MSNGRRLRRAEQGGPKRNACRRVDEIWPDGQQKFIWTLADGSGIQHDHREGRCPFAPGGRYFGQAEHMAAGFAAEGAVCPCCGKPAHYGGPALS